MKEIKGLIVDVHRGKDILDDFQMLRAKTKKYECHHNSAFNALYFDCMYVEGYAIDSNGVRYMPHAVNKTRDGVYFDCTKNEKVNKAKHYKFEPVREYEADEILDIFCSKGQSYLTIGNSL